MNSTETEIIIDIARTVSRIDERLNNLCIDHKELSDKVEGMRSSLQQKELNMELSRFTFSSLFSTGTWVTAIIVTTFFTLMMTHVFFK